MDGEQLGAQVQWTDLEPPVVTNGRVELTGVVGSQQFGNSVHRGLDFLPLGSTIPTTLLQAVQQHGQRQILLARNYCLQVRLSYAIWNIRQSVPLQGGGFEVKL